MDDQALFVDFDVFCRALEAGRNIDEVEFCVAGHPLYGQERTCWMGFLPSVQEAFGLLRRRVKRPYWLGLPDSEEGFDFLTAEEMMAAPVFQGKSLRELWPQVRIWTFSGQPIKSWLAEHARRNG